MIKLQLNRYKLISLIKIVGEVIETVKADRAELHYTTKRMELAAHLYTLQELSRKSRTKYISIEHKPPMQNFIFSVDEMQAYVLMLYKDIRIEKTGYDNLSMQEISVPIFKQLLN